jgi:hypothetical protein
MAGKRALMHSLVQQHLLRAQTRMKHQADKRRSEHTFSVGDWDYLKLHPYVQSSLAHRSNQKLAFKYFGPFWVLARIGSVAYKLELPPTSSVHPVFHVSQLKQSVGPLLVSPLFLMQPLNFKSLKLYCSDFGLDLTNLLSRC